MMRKLAILHSDTPSGKNVKFNIASAIELSDRDDFAHNFVRHLISANKFGGTFMRFSQRCLCTSPKRGFKKILNNLTSERERKRIEKGRERG